MNNRGLSFVIIILITLAILVLFATAQVFYIYYPALQNSDTNYSLTADDNTGIDINNNYFIGLWHAQENSVYDESTQSFGESQSISNIFFEYKANGEKCLEWDNSGFMTTGNEFANCKKYEQYYISGDTISTNNDSTILIIRERLNIINSTAMEITIETPNSSGTGYVPWIKYLLVKVE